MKNRDIFAHNLSDIGKSEVPVNVKSMSSGGQTSAFLAPNGKPSNLTPEQYRLVRTPEFKKWFGDWENPVRYTGYFVIDPEALQQKYPSSLPNKFYHHSTVKYGYQPFDTQDGNVKTLKITGRLTTDKVDVLLVDNPESANGYPHITLATANGIAAAESNQELVEHADQIEKLFDEVDTIFGNSFRHDVSKVVDENGEPLVVYRGMPSNRKVGNVFRYNVNLFGTKGNAGRRTNKFGFYFADIEGVANDYAENFVADDVKPVVKQYFLKIDNLFTAFSRPNQIKLAFNELFDLAAQNNPTVAKEFLQDNYHENAHYNFLTQAKATWNEDHVFRFFVDWDKYDNNQAFWKTLLKDKLGYDGLVFYEKTYGVSDWKKDEPIWKYGRAPKTYAVWDSNQIKLADGSNTTFDGDNPDIRFENGGSVENQSIKSYLQSDGFKILKNGMVKHGDVQVALWMQRKYILNRGQKYMVEVGSPFEPNDSDDYGLKIAVIDDIQNAGQHSQGSASLVLNKIIEAADKTKTTLQLFPQKHGSKGLSTKQLTDWYSRRGFTFINEFIMERKPTNP